MAGLRSVLLPVTDGEGEDVDERAEELSPAAGFAASAASHVLASWSWLV